MPDDCPKRNPDDCGGSIKRELFANLLAVVAADLKAKRPLNACEELFLKGLLDSTPAELEKQYFGLVQALDIITSDNRPALAADTYLYSMGLSKTSQTDLAIKHGITKAAVSKRVIRWRNLLE